MPRGHESVHTCTSTRVQRDVTAGREAVDGSREGPDACRVAGASRPVSPRRPESGRGGADPVHTAPGERVRGLRLGGAGTAGRRSAASWARGAGSLFRVRDASADGSGAQRAVGHRLILAGCSRSPSSRPGRALRARPRRLRGGGQSVVANPLAAWRRFTLLAARLAEPSTAARNPPG